MVVDLTDFLRERRRTFLPEFGKLLSVTTVKAREYHYATHARNAFHHLETVDLPFHEFRFSYEAGGRDIEHG